MSETKTHSEKLKLAEIPNDEARGESNPWKVLIVDDEIEVHHITRMVLDRLNYKGRSLELFYATSGAEAVEVMSANPDTAVILLDVVMETENAGLVTAKKIRDELNNHETRIILRTGHPGYAPEQRIIVDYDINDYKEKTELTSQKLVTSVIASLRAYSDIVKLRDLNLSLEHQVEERTHELEETNAKLNNSLSKIREDLEAGRRIQFRLLPARDKKFGKYLFTRYLVPSLYLSGDFVDYFQIDSTNVGFYFADVCGHGASSAFITVLLKSIIDKHIRDYDVSSREILKDPAEFLSIVNEQILKENIDKHLTLFYGVIDQANNVLSFAHGGQFPHPIVNNNKNSYFLDHKGGMPLGLYADAIYNEHTINLDEEFILVLFSDGILEILPQDTLIGRQNFLLSQINSTNLNQVDLLRMFNLDKPAELQDDITFLIIKK